MKADEAKLREYLQSFLQPLVVEEKEAKVVEDSGYLRLARYIRWESKSEVATRLS